MKTIETERLILRKWNQTDADDLLEICRSSMVLNAGWKIHESIEDSYQYIRSSNEYHNSWAIVLKENNKVIGIMDLNESRHDLYREMEYIMSEDYHNRGYMTEAVKCVLEYTFNELNVEVVAVCHYPNNVQSKRVIEKCGFTYEGTLRKYSRNLSDSVRYSMTKEEWEVKYGDIERSSL